MIPKYFNTSPKKYLGLKLDPKTANTLWYLQRPKIIAKTNKYHVSIGNKQLHGYMPRSFITLTLELFCRVCLIKHKTIYL